MSKARPRIGIVVSHPIQHFCPMYMSLALIDEWTIHVFFCFRSGSVAYYDSRFERNIQWQTLYLDNFSNEFLHDEIPTNLDTISIDSDKIEDRLSSFNPDVILVYGYDQPLQRRTIRWGNRNSRTILMITDSELHSQRSMLKRAVKQIVVRNIMRQISGCLTVGDSNEDYHQHYGVPYDRLFRTYFSIDLALYQKSWDQRTELRARLRSQLGVPQDALVCAVVGKLEARKRQADVLNALANLPPNVLTLLIIGSGSDADILRKLSEKIPEQVIHFVGFVDPMELPAYYAATDIYVHPSSYDPHPLAITEALYMGCAIISSRTVGSVGATDEIQVGLNALVYVPGDISALGKVLYRLITQHELRQYFSQNSHQIGVRNQQLAHGIGLRNALIALGHL